MVIVEIFGVTCPHPPTQEATASWPWRNAGVLRSLGEGGLELRRITPHQRCHGLLPVGLHCQKAAPSLNKLYEDIENSLVAKGRVKLIGIGAGNDIYEVDYYRKKYKIKFPLFDDEDYSIHEQIGEPGTPYFICVKVGDDGSPRVFYTQAGGFKRSADFLDKVLKESGLI